MTKIENRILKKFEATDVTIEIIDGVPMFELYSVGAALGYTKLQNLRVKSIFKFVMTESIKLQKMQELHRCPPWGNPYKRKSII